MLTLYHYFRSSASYRVRISLNIKSLLYHDIPVHLVNKGGEQFSEDFQMLNPQSLVPVLQDHEKTLTQSLAIIEYLEETHPSPALLPKDPFLRAQIRAFALAIASEIHPLNNLRVLSYLTDELNISDDQKSQWYHHWIATGLTALEKKLASSEFTSDFCFGKTPSMADVFLVPQLYNARRFLCDLSAYPTLIRIDAHCQQLEAFSKAKP